MPVARRRAPRALPAPPRVVWGPPELLDLPSPGRTFQGTSEGGRWLARAPLRVGEHAYTLLATLPDAQGQVCTLDAGLFGNLRLGPEPSVAVSAHGDCPERHGLGHGPHRLFALTWVSLLTGAVMGESSAPGVMRLGHQQIFPGLLDVWHGLLRVHPEVRAHVWRTALTHVATPGLRVPRPGCASRARAWKWPSLR